MTAGLTPKAGPFLNNTACISSAWFIGLHLWRWAPWPKSLYGREQYQEFAVSKSGRCPNMNKTHLQMDQQWTLNSFARGMWKMALFKYCIAHSLNNWASWQAFFSELERKLDSAQLCVPMRSEAHAKGGMDLHRRAGAVPSPPQHGARWERWGAERKRVGKVGWELIESQGHCSDSVIPSWKESVFVLNLVASDFQDVAGSLDHSGACLFTRLLGPGTEGCERKLLKWDTREAKGKAKGF